MSREYSLELLSLGGGEQVFDEPPRGNRMQPVLQLFDKHENILGQRFYCRDNAYDRRFASPEMELGVVVAGIPPRVEGLARSDLCLAEIPNRLPEHPFDLGDCHVGQRGEWGVMTIRTAHELLERGLLSRWDGPVDTEVGDRSGEHFPADPSRLAKARASSD